MADVFADGEVDSEPTISIKDYLEAVEEEELVNVLSWNLQTSNFTDFFIYFSKFITCIWS